MAEDNLSKAFDGNCKVSDIGEEQVYRTQIIDLPNDCLISVFNYLEPEDLYHVVSNVCQKFCTVALSPAYYRNLKFVLNNPNDHLVFPIIRDFHDTITSIQMKVCCEIRDDNMRKLFVHIASCKNLRSLKVDSDSIHIHYFTRNFFLEICMLCRKLRNIEIEGFASNGFFSIVDAWNNHLPKLKSVSIIGCVSNFTDIMTEDHVSELKNLKKFRLSLLSGNSAISPFLETICENNMNHLTVLEFSSPFYIMDDNLLKTISACKRLQSLSLETSIRFSDRPSYTSDGFSRLSNLSNLKSLLIRMSDEITTSDIINFLTGVDKKIFTTVAFYDFSSQDRNHIKKFIIETFPKFVFAPPEVHLYVQGQNHLPITEDDLDFDHDFIRYTLPK